MNKGAARTAVPFFWRKMETNIFCTDYNQADEALKWEIAVLLDKIWPDSELRKGNLTPTHRPALNARSFCLRGGEKLLGYAAVVQQSIRLGKTIFTVAGLSCVAVDPDWQGQRIGQRIVRSATEWIKNQPQIDFGIFTCHPSLSGFYQQAGGWQVQPQAVLLGSQEPGGLSSVSLGVDVLMLPFSHKATQNWDWIRRSEICLSLPVGDFW